MRRTTFPIWIIVLCLLFCACKDNVICPAFQSTYILDDSLRSMRYSMFLNDSTPKLMAKGRAATRTKYGINKKSSLFRKNYDLMTAPKVNVMSKKSEDSLYTEDEGEFLVADFVDTDSLSADSLSTAPLLAAAEDEEKEVKYKYRYDRNNAYNQDQLYYNKYYGDLFIDDRPSPEELAQRRQERLDAISADSTYTDNTEKRGLFKRKKNRESLVETTEEQQPETNPETEPIENNIESEGGFSEEEPVQEAQESNDDTEENDTEGEE